MQINRTFGPVKSAAPWRWLHGEIRMYAQARARGAWRGAGQPSNQRGKQRRSWPSCSARASCSRLDISQPLRGGWAWIWWPMRWVECGCRPSTATSTRKTQCWPGMLKDLNRISSPLEACVSVFHIVEPALNNAVRRCVLQQHQALRHCIWTDLDTELAQVST